MSVVGVVLGAHLERGRLWSRQAELEQVEDMSDGELEEYNQIGETLAAMRADADPPRAQKILHGLGFSKAQMEGPLTALSGGWRARIALAQGLFMQPDLLLLDEPTNHLDLDGVLWLSEYLKSWPSTLIIISHNVGFVRSVARTIWHLHGGTLSSFRGSYDRFQKQRALDLAKQEKDWTALDKTLRELKKKGTPAARKEAETLLAKRTAEGITRPEKAYAPKFFFVEAPPTTARGSLLSVSDAQLGYPGRTVLSGVTFALHQGCRVALVGANGSGKSTLIRFLSGDLEADVSATQKAGLRVCTFDQHFYHGLPEEQTPLEFLESKAPVTEDGARIGRDQVRKILGATGLEGAAHTRPIGTLSGGQKARVYFGSLAIQGPDILLMDEPTNHLDIETIEGLAAGLRNFPGAVVIVSHDVDFLEEVATEVWVTRDGGVTRLSEGIDGLELYVKSVLDGMDF
jgi:ATP-binding cassette subfamily F protein 3